MKCLFLTLCVAAVIPFSRAGEKWTVEKAKGWYNQQGWMIGCNYIPSTAVNVLEMWQAETFDMMTIDRELQWAQNIGFNFTRVFLHYLLWDFDSAGFKDRLDLYLQFADSHKIKTMFVLFDDCWNGFPELGTQPEPIPGVHNSRWVKCPGYNEVSNKTLYPIFENYVKDIIDTFKNDNRVILWDLYNEPGSDNLFNETIDLIAQVFSWAREVNPSQPLTSAVFTEDRNYDKLNNFQLSNSDIISFHQYGNIQSFRDRVSGLREIVGDRPMFCSEYLARTHPFDSNFETHLPFMKRNNIGAINWGLVDGRTQTIYPWDSWQHPYTLPPKLWHHDIFNKYGSPFNATEIKIIKTLTNSNL